MPEQMNHYSHVPGYLKKKKVIENESVQEPSANKSKHLIIRESQAEFNHRSELKVCSESGTSN